MAVAVLGLDDAEVPVTQTLITRGTRAFRSAKDDGLRQLRVNSYMHSNQKSIPLLVMPAWALDPKQLMWLPT